MTEQIGTVKSDCGYCTFVCRTSASAKQTEAIRKEIVDSMCLPNHAQLLGSEVHGGSMIRGVVRCDEHANLDEVMGQLKRQLFGHVKGRYADFKVTIGISLWARTRFGLSEQVAKAA